MKHLWMKTHAIYFLLLSLLLPSCLSKEEVHSRQKRILWVTADGRLALPPGTTLVITPSLSLPFVRYPPDGFFSNMTVSLPFTSESPCLSQNHILNALALQLTSTNSAWPTTRTPSEFCLPFWPVRWDERREEFWRITLEACSTTENGAEAKGRCRKLLLNPPNSSNTLFTGVKERCCTLFWKSSWRILEWTGKLVSWGRSVKCMLIPCRTSGWWGKCSNCSWRKCPVKSMRG